MVVFGLGFAIAATYWPSVAALNGYWTDTTDHTYTHGYLVLLTSIWLMLRARKRLAGAPIRPVPAAWAIVLALSAAWLVFWRGAIQDAHLLLLPLLLFFALVATLGWRSARALLFPIGFLYFAMPVWSDINGILQHMSFVASGGMLRLTGIPADLKGDLIQLPAGTLEIAEGCSGLHFFIVGLTLAALYGELSGDPWRRRLLWVAMMGGLALIANWVRIYVVAIAAYLSDMRSSLVPHHYWFGWAVFVVVFVGFLWLAGRMADAWDRKHPVVTGQPATESPASETYPGIRRALLTLLCLAVLPTLSYAMAYSQSGAPAEVVIDWRAPPAGWRGPLPVLWSEWAPVYENASAKGQQRYLDEAGQPVEVFTAAYRDQRQGAKLLGYFNSLLGANGRLNFAGEGIVSSPAGGWRETTAVDTAGTPSLIWSRYRIGSRLFVDPRLSQLWYGIAALASRPVSSLTALRAVCRPDCAAARIRLTTAAVELRPTLRLIARKPGELP
jgi:exosortase